MILHAYSVYDLKGAAFAAPFFMHTDAIAIRMFSDTVADPSHPIARHPEDYQLYRLGDFDDATGQIVPLQLPVLLVNGLGEVVP